MSRQRMSKHLKCLIIISFLPLSTTFSYSSVGRGKFSPYLRNDNEINDLQIKKALDKGEFVKIICGASNQDIPMIRNLCFIYTVVGVDCIDISADLAVITAAINGIDDALKWLQYPLSDMMNNVTIQKPYLMISVNDNEDPHFRKASFNPELCPIDCPRPCEKVCPSSAIPPRISSADTPTPFPKTLGVIADRCYGCGRCVPICPLQLINTESYVTNKNEISKILRSGMVDAIEIHTRFDHFLHFESLLQDIGGDILERLKILSVSFTDMDTDTIQYLNKLRLMIQRHPSYGSFQGVHIWQTDGRSMSGDIGRGTAHSAVDFATRVLRDWPELQSQSGTGQSQRDFIQLAGGTNDYSATVAADTGLADMAGFGGYSFGGYARKQIGVLLRDLEETYTSGTNRDQGELKVEDNIEVFEECLRFAKYLVGTVKQ